MSYNEYINFRLTTADGVSEVRVYAPKILSMPSMPYGITTEVRYSIAGAVIASGNQYEGRLLWDNVRLYLEPEQYLAFSGMVARQEYARRNGDTFNIKFDNALYPHVERNNQRTRAIATGAATLHDDGTISYFAKYNVCFPRVEPNKLPYGWDVGLTIQELEKTTP